MLTPRPADAGGTTVATAAHLEVKQQGAFRTLLQTTLQSVQTITRYTTAIQTITANVGMLQTINHATPCELSCQPMYLAY